MTKNICKRITIARIKMDVYIQYDNLVKPKGSIGKFL